MPAWSLAAWSRSAGDDAGRSQDRRHRVGAPRRAARGERDGRRTEPRALAPRPFVVVAIPGGTYHRRYWDLHPPGRRGFSQAEFLAERGVVVVACDYLGGGDSSWPDDGDFIGLEVQADAAHGVFEHVRDSLAQGALLDALPPVADPTIVGIGQSLGGFITMIQQGKYADYPAIGIFGASPLLIANTREQPEWERLSAAERRAWITAENTRQSGGHEFLEAHELSQYMQQYTGLRIADAVQLPPAQRAATTPGPTRWSRDPPTPGGEPSPRSPPGPPSPSPPPAQEIAMSTPKARPTLSRRTLLAGGGVLGGAALLGGRVRDDGRVTRLQPSAAVTHPRKEVHLVGTDGWVSMPTDAPADPPFFPDSLAPSPFDTYVFGFRDVTGLTAAQMAAQRGKAQISAPMLAFDEEDDIFITLTNLGLLQRPDLFDGHTLHWHGFVNAIPLFDGVPELSLAVPVGRDFTYFYRPHDAGTYMYHCHFEDVEHVQMGMTGMVFVRPKQNRNPVAGHPIGHQVRLQRRRRLDPVRPRVRVHDHRAVVGGALPRRAHPGQRLDRLRRRASGCSTAVATPTRSQPNGNPMLTAAGRLQYQPISLAGHLQRRRPGAAAAVQPRLPEPRDDGRQHRPHRGRQGRLPAARPGRHESTT